MLFIILRFLILVYDENSNPGWEKAEKLLPGRVR